MTSWLRTKCRRRNLGRCPSFFLFAQVALFGVPGAFTGVCTASHLPGFIQNADKLKSKGVDEIICLTVNDPEVSKAWANHVNAGDKVSIIADWDGSLTRALDQEIDLSVGALGKRCKRFAGLIDDGSVKDISTESNPGEVTVSSAESLAERI
eukprot:gb/GECG01002349.1/.p1 GENE.gb/GECG01002349.1/~~gb/GECG01002349.1/.p1  ORF type:complete len:152 (+),score=14.98 gb/GECG01002349.1/:1-456(+)